MFALWRHSFLVRENFFKTGSDSFVSEDGETVKTPIVCVGGFGDVVVAVRDDDRSIVLDNESELVELTLRTERKDKNVHEQYFSIG